MSAPMTTIAYPKSDSAKLKWLRHAVCAKTLAQTVAMAIDYLSTDVVLDGFRAYCEEKGCKAASVQTREDRWEALSQALSL